MTFKRFIAVALAVLLLLGALPEILPEALAAPSEDGCPKSSSGKHSWYSRPRSAWCDYAGGNVWICSFCNKTVFEETTPALGHDWPAWTVTKTATCTEKGSRTRTCNRCHKVETQELAVLGHYFPNPWKTVKEPACEEAGQEVNYCTRCGYEWRRELEAIGHDWDEGVVTKKPTAYEEGEKTYTCKNDSSHTKTEPIPAKIGLTSQTVKIVWDDNDDEARLRPTQIKVDFEEYAYPDPEETKTVILNSGNGWSWTFNDLPEHTENGFWIFYTWSEHTDDLPEVYKLVNAETTETETVFTNAYYASLTDPHPSLELSVEVGDVRSYDNLYVGSGYLQKTYVNATETVTNTGNIPLAVQKCAWFNNDTGIMEGDLDGPGMTLAPQEPHTKETDYTVDYYYTSSDDPAFGSYGHSYVVLTPDDPVYYGYSTVSVCYYGYDANTIEFSGEEKPLCQSNVVTFTVYVPREKAEALPTLDAVKSVAHLPKDGEYFHEGEQIDWSLTVTNTGDDAITDVVVDDKGTTVGSFDKIDPEETLPCSVPGETVTEYEAKVVGYVTNYATATGKDVDGAEHSWPSNTATAQTKKLTDEDDPLGPIYGVKVAATITKEETHGPLNGEYFALNETIDYTIKVKNTGEVELKNVTITDSLNGDTPIGTLDSLAPGEEKEFSYSYMVTQDDIDHHWVVNMALLSYTFGDNIGGTPRSSEKVRSKAGEGDGPVDHFDPEKLPDGDCCSLTLDALGDTEAQYTLHICDYHLKTLADAEAAAEEGDWDEAVEIWLSEIWSLYDILYQAGDSEVKAAVTEARALFMAYAEKYALAVNAKDAEEMKQNTLTMYEMLLTAAKDDSRRNQLIAERDALLSDLDAYGEGVRGEALTRMLRLRCAALCYSMHTLPERHQSSLTGGYEKLAETEMREMSTREFGGMSGSDCAVTEYYGALAAKALKDVRSMLSETGYGSLDKIFLKGQSFWQAALDEEVKPIYLEADETRKQDIGAWRVTLDSLLPAERALLELMYPEAPYVTEELLMDLYKDAALFTGSIR